jgi:hypothetical protein
MDPRLIREGKALYTKVNVEGGSGEAVEYMASMAERSRDGSSMGRTLFASKAVR